MPWHPAKNFVELTGKLVACALVGQVLQDSLLSRGRHAAYQPQTVSHLRPLVPSARLSVETITTATKTVCEMQLEMEFTASIIDAFVASTII